MPVFNGAPYIAEALRSLTSQDHERLEIIVSDNASTDDTEAICRDFAARDARISFERLERNAGAVENFHRVFGRARGEYFMWAAHDDLWHERFISACKSALDDDSAAVLAHPQQQSITLGGDPLGAPFSDHANDSGDLRSRWRRVLGFWQLHIACYGLMKRSAAQRTRLLLPVPAADLVFVAEMSLLGKVVQVPEVLFWSRVVPERARHRPREELGFVLTGEHNAARISFAPSLLRRCIEGLERTEVEPAIARVLKRDAFLVYWKSALWFHDVKKLARAMLGQRFYDRLKGRLAGSGAALV